MNADVPACAERLRAVVVSAARAIPKSITFGPVAESTSGVLAPNVLARPA